VVKIDGIDVRDVTLESLSEQIGMVYQELLFSRHHPHQVCSMQVEAPAKKEVETACGLPTSTISRGFADGYDTIVGERGYR
jgi:ABC-type transport system involved in Fe-S cluster assembly fused permease/ATPase subunit